MIDSQALDLDHIGSRRDHYFDLCDHFSQAEQLAKEVGEPQMDKIAKDCGSLVELVKRLLLREVTHVDEAFLDEQTRGLYAVNLEGAQRGTPLEKPYVRNEI